MNYLPGNNFRSRSARSSRRSKTLFLAALVLFTIIIFVWGGSLLSGLGRTVSIVVRPILPAAWSQLFIPVGLPAENEALKRELDQLKLELLAKTSLEAENQELKNLLGVSKQPVKTRPAKVLSRPDQTPYDILLVESNWATSTRVGERVLADGEVILGQVEAVQGGLAKVKLFSSAGVELPVSVGNDHVPTIASGLGGGNFFISLPRAVKVAVGDPVRTTLLGDYLLGTVAQIENDPNEPFQKLFFKSPISLFQIGWVELEQK